MLMFNVLLWIYGFIMAGLTCQMLAIIPYRGTLSPPAFKFICYKRNVSFFWGIWALCAAAWLTVAEAYPCMELFWLWHWKPSVNPHQHRITVNYPIIYPVNIPLPSLPVIRTFPIVLQRASAQGIFSAGTAIRIYLSL